MTAAIPEPDPMEPVMAGVILMAIILIYLLVR